MKWIRGKFPVIDNQNPKHYVFRNWVNNVVTNIYTGYIENWPPLLLPKDHWEWLDESEDSTEETNFIEISEGLWDKHSEHRDALEKIADITLDCHTVVEVAQIRELALNVIK